MARKPTGGSAAGTKALSKDRSGAAKASREDEVLMREIDEAVRQDDATLFMKKYGPTLGVALVAVLAGLFVWWYFDSTGEAELERQSETIIAALDSTDARDFDGADERVATLIDEGEPGARTAARFLQAANALEQGEQSRAIELYAAISTDPDAPQPLRDLARIREVAASFDTLEPGEVISRLEGLATPGNPFFGSAGELVAIAQLEAGNEREAGIMFANIARDEELPETLRGRARQMAGLLGVNAIEDVDQLLQDEGIVAAEGTE